MSDIFLQGYQPVAIEKIDRFRLSTRYGILNVYSSILLLLIQHFVCFIIKTQAKMLVTVTKPGDGSCFPF